MSAPVARSAWQESSGRHCRGGYSRRDPAGQGLDILQAGPVEGVDVQLTGANDYAPTADSDIVVFTAGFPASPE